MKNIACFYDKCDDMLSNKTLNLIVTELTFLNISLVFITQSYFTVPKKLD